MHTTDDAVPVPRRSFTKSELQRLLDYIDDLIPETRPAPNAGRACFVTLWRPMSVTPTGFADAK